MGCTFPTKKAQPPHHPPPTHPRRTPSTPTPRPRAAFAGKFFLVQFPQVAQLLLPLDPLIRLYYSFPLAGLILFFAVYLVGAVVCVGRWRKERGTPPLLG